MGFQNVQAINTPEERNRIIHYILQDIKALKRMLKEGLIEKNTHRVGAEQEFCLVDKGYRRSLNALEILKKIDDPHFTTELALFNLEINLDPQNLEGTCFSDLKNQLTLLLDKAHKAAAAVDSNKVLLTGILPTLSSKDLIFENMTPLERYQTLNKILTDIKQEDFRIYIKGVDELFLKHKSILFEACNTSFQIHLQIDPDEAIAMYNWSQMIAGPVLALTSNSPLLFGRELWSETRIAIFQQSIDTRNTTYLLHEERPRVSFGRNWIKDSIVDVYRDDVARYPVIMTSDEIQEDAIETLNQGKIPKLDAINLHNGTLYKWNRLCYGVTSKIPHLRIENRYIPSGPSVEDEIANTLFWVGLMRGMPQEYNEIWKLCTFKDVRGNFYNAARTGLESTFNWFDKSYTARKLAKKVLIPLAISGLEKSGIDEKDIKHYISIIKDRLKSNTTGSKWTIRSFRKLKESVSKDEANVILTAGMYKRQCSGIPVSSWDLVSKEEGGTIPETNNTVEKVMETQLFAVNENDPIRLVKRITKWKKIKHLPVVNANQNIIGVITSEILESIKDSDNDYSNTTPTNEVMSRSVVMVTIDTSVEEATEIIAKQKVPCVFVMDNNHLVGIFSNDTSVK